MKQIQNKVLKLYIIYFPLIPSISNAMFQETLETLIPRADDIQLPNYISTSNNNNDRLAASINPSNQIFTEHKRNHENSIQGTGYIPASDYYNDNSLSINSENNPLQQDNAISSNHKSSNNNGSTHSEEKNNNQQTTHSSSNSSCVYYIGLNENLRNKNQNINTSPLTEANLAKHSKEIEKQRQIIEEEEKRRIALYKRENNIFLEIYNMPNETKKKDDKKSIPQTKKIFTSYCC